MKIIVFLSMFICTIDAIPLSPLHQKAHISPSPLLRKAPLLATFQTNPSAFLSAMEAMSKVDPGALSAILTSLRELLQASQSREQELDEDLQEKTGALDEANRAVGEAEEASRIANEKKTQAEEEAAAASAHLQAESSNRDTKQAAKDAAQSTRAGEIDSLQSEQEVLLNVIGILEDLLGKNTVAPTAAPTTQSPTVGNGRCPRFVTGDGAGRGGEAYLGEVSSVQQCIDWVGRQSSRNGYQPNGVTVSPSVVNGGSGRCYVEYGMSGPTNHNGNGSWRTCFLG